MALAYLLCPTFQIENTAGKPATGGWLEVYIAGSREKYYCASDFNGTLHPFRIELDSLGSNIVLANDTQAYDVYVYNRYGGLMMSRYGVKPGAGGGISAGSITSTDGSIIVTPTANGVDLRVDSELPTSMRCSAADLQESDTFEFVEEQRNGADASVNNNGQVVVNSGWWHYDVVVRLKWPANPAENTTSDISLHAPNGSSSSYFDRSYSHDETLQLSGEYKCTQDGTVFPVSIQGVPSGMTVELVDFGIHSVTGEGGGGGIYNAGNGIVIDEPNRVISVDTDVIATKAELANYVTDTELDTILEDYATTSDLSQYATRAEVSYGLSGKQDVLTAGSNIQLNGSTISATDTTYTAGSGLELSGTEFSVDTTVIQEKLTAGSNIVIDGTTISATGGDTEIYTVEYTGPAVEGTVFDEAYAAYLAGKTLVVKDGDYTGTLCHYSSAYGLLFAIMQPNLEGSGSTAATEGVVNYMWLYKHGTQSRWGFSGLSLLPRSYAADAGKVLMVNPEYPTSHPIWASLPDLSAYVTDTELSTILQGYQEALTAGSNITISNGTISATDTTYTAGTGLDLTGTEFSVDTTTIATKADLADYTPTASLGAVALSNDYDDLDNKPTIPVLPTTKDLVAGNNITITEGQGTVTIAAAAAPQLQANWNESSPSSVQYIQNKPAIPVLPDTKDLVAGNNITITEGQDDVTVACSITIGTVTV